MPQDWTEKHRPRTLAAVIGNPKAVGQLREWARSWKAGVPKLRAAVLIGTPGVGKTSAALALAAEMGWGVVEMNASDQRTGDAIRSVALRGALSGTFNDDGEYLGSGRGRKLIILDEADNLFGTADRGALPAISELVKTTLQPVILIVNDFYALSRRSSAVKTSTLQITFMRPSASSAAKALAGIAKAEGVEVGGDALARIAANANGDMRAAVRDLESLALGRSEVTSEDASQISDRMVRKSMYDLMGAVFRRGDAAAARAAMRDVDEEPGYVLLWIDENLPHEYRDVGDLVRGYERASRADVFLGRVGRRQHYGFWSYAGDMMSAGVCAARMSGPPGRDRFRFPGYMMKMSRSKSARALKSAACLKLARGLHTSTKRVSADVLQPLGMMLAADPELRSSVAGGFGLEPEELAFLLNAKVDSKEVKAAYAAAAPAAEPAPPEKKTAAAKPKPARAQRSLFEFRGADGRGLPQDP